LLLPVRAIVVEMGDSLFRPCSSSLFHLWQRERLAELHSKQQREGLNAEEQGEERALLALYRETILVRAQAALLLKQRGYDVRDPQQVAPSTITFRKRMAVILNGAMVKDTYTTSGQTRFPLGSA
jgi:hypothetical protein